ncbi:hypothetical protein F5B22DRAFT_582248 [Xylaria bambusicola]|uniref:uncharacterized protein n=1 Tax=Xylaria bambusicola TaxID=326684 RepID=UPI002008B717|nr:uncharacterized protein F5B22DRAFT_582248 [Xylaria bambusicola]KAI0527766.1 hypothetical protein F5B22DRAFT_582248 [Xylaria bambusicola]
MRLTAALYGLAAAIGALAQSDEYPPLKSDGPYALHVKGQCNSSIDGYLYAVHEFSTDHDPDTGVSVLHYAPVPAPMAGNSSYRFYFNTSVDDDSGLGFVVTDIHASNATNLYKGKAMFWTYFPDTNVAILELGEGADPYNVQFVGFGEDEKAFVYAQHDDSTAVVGKPGPETSVNLYGWAICWQTRYTVTGFTLSWITYGKPHNPTCERVDLTRLKL